MGRQHPDKSLENALHRIVKQRTLATLSMKNVAFVLEHQDDTLDDLTEYLRARRMELTVHRRARRSSAGTLSNTASAAGERLCWQSA